MHIPCVYCAYTVYYCVYTVYNCVETVHIPCIYCAYTVSILCIYCAYTVYILCMWLNTESTSDKETNAPTRPKTKAVSLHPQTQHHKGANRCRPNGNMFCIAASRSCTEMLVLLWHMGEMCAWVLVLTAIWKAQIHIKWKGQQRRYPCLCSADWKVLMWEECLWPFPFFEDGNKEGR